MTANVRKIRMTGAARKICVAAVVVCCLLLSAVFGGTIGMAASGYCGDMDGDGLASSGDAIKILRISLGLSPFTDASDVNRNGVADAGDAIKVLRCVAGMDEWPITGDVGVVID